jgi:hypothetical protein
MELRATTAVESDPGTWYVRGHDAEGKPIRYRIRKLPGEVEQALITQGMGNRKVNQDETQASMFSRNVARLRKRATMALVDAENATISLLDPAAAERLGAEPGAAAVDLGAVIRADRGDAFFRLFPSEQTWVCERLDQIAALDREVEVEESKT